MMVASVVKKRSSNACWNGLNNAFEQGPTPLSAVQNVDLSTCNPTYSVRSSVWPYVEKR